MSTEICLNIFRVNAICRIENIYHIHFDKHTSSMAINFLSANDNFCHLLIAFAATKHWACSGYKLLLLKDASKKLIFKKSTDHQNHAKLQHAKS